MSYRDRYQRKHSITLCLNDDELKQVEELALKYDELPVSRVWKTDNREQVKAPAMGLLLVRGWTSENQHT